MRPTDSRRPAMLLVLTALVLTGALCPAFGLQAPATGTRFDARVIPDPTLAANPAIRTLASFEAESSLAPAVTAGWASFRAIHGERWSVWIDARSGAPSLVQGEGIPWIPGSGNSLSEVSAPPPTVDSLGASLRTFLRDHVALLAVDTDELVLNRQASSAISPELWQIVFDRVVDGVPVTGDGFVFMIGHGNLISFGSPRWSSVSASPVPTIDAGAALARVRSHLGLEKSEPLALYDAGSLAFTPMQATGTEGGDFTGAVGAGYRSALTWRFVFGGGDDTAATWVALVDAHSGEVVAFYDDTKYGRVRGGVYLVSSDGVCPDGCENGNYPMPFAQVIVDGLDTASNSTGVYSCPDGTSSMPALASRYVQITDTCGPFSAVGNCTEINLGASASTADCAVPAGASAGDTHAARSAYYHINRIGEHVRGWLPGNVWLGQQLTTNTNVNLTCNAFWNAGAGTLSFYREAATCRNSGTIGSVIHHEWGHGLSQNDGAGASSPDEAYADITAFFQTHSSCIGRGFYKSQNCPGYGNPCTLCTGVRDDDFARRSSNTPMTPATAQATCATTGTLGPCGREYHCEGYIAGETLWDLAVRDLPGSGIDVNTSWMLADRLWFKSRQGTSGAAYSCGPTATTRSCAVTHWMQQLRALDDDDGNLANGTPHAAAIYTAFNRHQIMCGAAGDATNLSTTSCPALSAPSLASSHAAGFASLGWTAVAGAASYNVYRNDQGCSAAFTLVTNQTDRSYAESGLIPGFTMYYAVQAVGANGACLSQLSNCVAVNPTASSANISVSMTDSPDPVATGSTITYTVTVTNGGPDASYGGLYFDVPPETTFVFFSSPSTWSCTSPIVGGSGQVNCTSGAIFTAPSTSTFTLVVSVRSCVGNISLPNSAHIGAGNDSTTGNDTANVSTTITDNGSCSDGNSCTVGDACQGGACVPGPPPPPPPDVNNSVRLSGNTISWSDTPGTFNVYGGGHVAGSPWTYNQSCRAAAITAQSVNDGIMPATGALWHYLVSRRGTCDTESALGRDSQNTPVPNVNPCP